MQVLAFTLVFPASKSDKDLSAKRRFAADVGLDLSLRAWVVGQPNESRNRCCALQPLPNFETNGEPKCALPRQYPFATIQMIA